MFCMQLLHLLIKIDIVCLVLQHVTKIRVVYMKRCCGYANQKLWIHCYKVLLLIY